MGNRSRVVAGISAVLLTLVAAAGVAAYQNQVEGALSISIRAAATCGHPTTLMATVLDANGAAVSGQSVAWSFVSSPSASDTISPTPTITNAQGKTSTTLTLGNESGARKIKATAVIAGATMSGTVVFTPSCGGLPNTSTVPAQPAGDQGSLGASILLALAFVAGGTLALRRPARARR